MKVSLVSINAKYVHTGLAGRYLYHSTQSGGATEVSHHEFTINQPVETIVSELMRAESHAYGFSVYIWNLKEVLQVVRQIKKIRPETVVFLGGPEVSFEEADLMKAEPAIDLIVRGEGERVFQDLLQREFEPASCTDLDSLTYRKGREIIRNPLGQPTPMAQLPFGYNEADLREPGKIFYYESSRGCPYNCAFCLSAQDGNHVRYRPEAQVMGHMDVFLKAGVKQVKFIDRTFNADPKRALNLIDYLERNHNGITNFHFECSPDRLTEDFIDRLATLPEGMIQFEIGIQSTNPETTRAIHRPREIDQYRRKIGLLRQPDNIHLHVDLIAGLPFEDYDSFGRSFDDVFSLNAHVIQLGFLKLLKGSELRIRNGEYGLTCGDDAPYEVLKTPWLPYQDLQKLKWIEDLVDKYYNSQGFLKCLPFALQHFESPFQFFEAFARYWVERNLHLRKHRRGQLYEILSAFSANWPLTAMERVEWEELLLFDSIYATGEPYRKDHFATAMKRSEKNILAEAFLASRASVPATDRKKRVPDVTIARFKVIGSYLMPGQEGEIALVFFKKRQALFVSPSEIYRLKELHQEEEKEDVQFQRLDLCL